MARLLAGDDALLLAPTAGGKTEAALFPLLTGESREPELQLDHVGSGSAGP